MCTDNTNVLSWVMNARPRPPVSKRILKAVVVSAFNKERACSPSMRGVNATCSRMA